MKNVILSALVTLLVLTLFFTSLMLGASDGCADAGYDTFAVGEYGVYCLNQGSFESLDEPIYTEGDL